MTRIILCSLIALCCSLPLYADQATTKTATAMASTTQAFLKTLNDDQRKIAVMDFDNPERVDWHNIPKPRRKGLQYRDMTKEQQQACMAIIKSALSDDGFKKAQNILALENNLKEGEKNMTNGQLRDPERYFLTVFGTPGTKGKWGWSFEGHHLSLNFVINDGVVIADSPNFWGSNPATVKVYVEGGPEVGTRNLANEEQLALDLINSLSDEQRKSAIIEAVAPAEYRNAGQPQAPQTSPEGLQASKMNAEQQATLKKLLAVYCNHLAPDVAAADIEQLNSDGLDRTYFCWKGATKPGVGHYYRVQGPTFILEFINVQEDFPQGNKANHIHSVWRNMKGDFAIPVAKGS